MFGNLMSKLMGAGGSAADEASFDDVAAALREGTALIVDVREANEFASGHIAKAINRPLSSFDPGALPAEKPVILYCLSGARSASALAACRRAGRSGDRNYREGAPGWRARGGQIER